MRGVYWSAFYRGGTNGRGVSSHGSSFGHCHSKATYLITLDDPEECINRFMNRVFNHGRHYSMCGDQCIPLALLSAT